MRRAALSGATTVMGTVLATWAVYQGLRLDWAETALMTGIGLFVYGATLLWEMVKEMTREGTDE